MVLSSLRSYGSSSKWTSADSQGQRSTTALYKPALQEKSSSAGNISGRPDSVRNPHLDDSLPLPVLHHVESVQSRRKAKSVRMNTFSVHWEKFKRRIGTATGPSSSSIQDTATGESVFSGRVQAEDSELVDEVVVDREWSDHITQKSSVAASEHGESPEKTGSYHRTGTSIHESFSPQGFWGSNLPLIVIRWRIIPAIYRFFNASFTDHTSERHYNQENWFLKKPLALWASLWLITNWVLGVVIVPKPWSILDIVFYYAVAPTFSIPVVIMVMYDWPRDRPKLYQSFLVISIWIWAFNQSLGIYLCGNYNPSFSKFSCGGKDFLGTFYYTTALQVIGLFGLHMKRLPAAIGATTFFVITCATIVPLRSTWIRSMINFAFFHAFLIYCHYMGETFQRRLYTLRDQLKIQYKATQKAQVSERKASDSKRRLTSYVFHEVRVPLNTAMLAVQNMQAANEVHISKRAPSADDQDIEFNALVGSLSMMSKVLNDVLDFNRMDSGKFESVARPYCFHQAMRSIFVPLKLTTDARGLEFTTELDDRVDYAARRAAYMAMGDDLTTVERKIAEDPDIEGMVIGDEIRLRQIITNLASNGCKFTPKGGKLKITTRLILPTSLTATGDAQENSVTVDDQTKAQDMAEKGQQLSASHLSQHNNATNPPKLEWLVVRIEVTDTGYGIRPQDMAHGKLFSAFNQTEQGRQQGGKGTGLGLALVRQIVKRSGGRLGVISQLGVGSTFWVEMPLGVGAKTLNARPNAEMVQGSRPKTSSSKSGGSSNDPISHNLSKAIRAGVSRTDSSPAPSPSEDSRSPAALHSLMEQGGRVDLTLPRRKRPSADSDTQLRALQVSQDTISTLVATPTPVAELDPLGVAPMNDTKNASKPTNEPIGAGLEVLVVDDDPLTRTLMKRLLTRLGCTVVTATNGKEAVELIVSSTQATTPSTIGSQDLEPILERESSGSKYAVVFLDNQMPVLSGLQAVAQLREMGSKDFVVGVTGNALLSDQEEYLAAGVDKVLTKPVLERSLKEMLVVAIERRQNTPP